MRIAITRRADPSLTLPIGVHASKEEVPKQRPSHMHYERTMSTRSKLSRVFMHIDHHVTRSAMTQMLERRRDQMKIFPMYKV